MEKHKRIGRAYHDLPWHYDKGEEVFVVFRTDHDVLASLLPPMMEMPDGPALATVYAVHHARSTFGPYTGVYLGMIAQYRGEPVLHRLTGMKTTFSGTAAGREMWGHPLQTGDASMEWSGDVLNIVAGRHGRDFVRLSFSMERRIDPPVKPFTASTSIARRPPWEEATKPNVLLGGRSEPADPDDMTFWSGDAVLELVGGDPGDDWSILPVFEVVESTYNIGGQAALTGAYILEEF
ncbi:acetoacetate decarboxylase family protein [Arthrobacter sp. Z4-13]